MLFKILAGVLGVAVLGGGTFVYVNHNDGACPLGLFGSSEKPSCCPAAEATCTKSNVAVSCETPSCCEESATADLSEAKPNGEVLAVEPREVK